MEGDGFKTEGARAVSLIRSHDRKQHVNKISPMTPDDDKHVNKISKYHFLSMHYQEAGTNFLARAQWHR